MINAYIVSELRRAECIFRKQGAPNMAHSCKLIRGAMADTMEPDESDAHRMIMLANGEAVR